MSYSKVHYIVLTSLSFVLLLGVTPRASSQQPFPSASQDAGSAAQKYFTDVVLVDQNGQQKRLFTDLMKDKVVIVHTFISTCTGACPVINSRMQALQEAIGDKLAKQVHMVSISVDPVSDTPQRRILAKAAEAEDAVNYNEPPDWDLPVRELLGGALLLNGDNVEAEKVFRAEIARHQRNGRGLFGLSESLKRQGKDSSAQMVQREFEVSWANADTKLTVVGLAGMKE